MITLEKAIEQAEKMTGEVFTQGLAEVKKTQAHRLDTFIAEFVHDPLNDPCRCPACQIAEETNEVAISKEAWIIEAFHTIQHGVQIITIDQVSRWDGVRALIELCPVDVSPRDYAAFPVVEETDEPQGPLPAAILADMIDHQADELADLAKEIEIYSISHSHHADELRGAAKQLVGWAKKIREDANK